MSLIVYGFLLSFGWYWGKQAGDLVDSWLVILWLKYKTWRSDRRLARMSSPRPPDPRTRFAEKDK